MENYKTLVKEFRNDIKNGNIYCVLAWKNILKKSVFYPKQSVDLKQSLSNYPWHFSQN